MTSPTGRHAVAADTAKSEGVYEWLSARVALYLRRSPETVDPTVPLAEYGMDSVAALSLCGDLEDEFGLEVEPTLLWDYPTVASLVRHLTAVLPDASAGPSPARGRH
ncbi:acyl carrier protein [Streptomyces sp. NPDC005426]|uniref:acyl carrier protein n=1 Tax=Streptomyces sp. NPDC005426 TaxID=3155344 RepID=UPI00339EB4BE